MTSILKTPGEAGNLSFISGVVKINGYALRDYQYFCDVFSGKIVDSSAVKLKSIVVHELTHLMDLATTNWGVEYTLRKVNMYESRGLEDFRSKFEVFMLNQSEIVSHNYVSSRVAGRSVKDYTTLKHGLTNHEDYGPIIVIIYYCGSEEICRVPLSMLSLLEAHATAEEYLAKSTGFGNSEDGFISLRLMKTEYSELINDDSSLEYSLLLNIVNTHFKELFEFEEELRFISALSRFSLDVSGFSLSGISKYYVKRFQNREVGADLCMDMCRGMSRQVIFFLTTLHIYEYLDVCSDVESNILKNLLKSEPFKAIVYFYEVILGISQDQGLNDYEFSLGLKFMPDHGALPDKKFFTSIANKNRVILNDNCLSDIYDELHYPRITLEDGTEVEVGRVIEGEHNQFVVDNKYIYTEIEKIYMSSRHVKFYPVPGTGLEFFKKNGLSL
ncbi:hypothetical protein [Cobetia sp. QF-1]|uniref:hypothetical protein n=1 Tax=Cobetia sp. QF-1 TaxID=1969833 RepID=UPI00113276BF|nr:hypothetical protein [Cobetia sp. QF-1]